MSTREKQVQINTLIGKDAELLGDFTAAGSVRIDGKVTGNVTISGTLIIGAGGSIDGSVSAEAVVVGGEVTGDIIAPKKAELTSTAKVLGDITTGVIVIDENAVFQGRCDMNQEIPDKKLRARNAKAIRNGRKTAKAAIAEALKEVAEEAGKEEASEESGVAEKEETSGI